MAKGKLDPFTVNQCLHWIAQGAINVTEGLTEIQPGSLIHHAMEELCRHAQAGFSVNAGGECVQQNAEPWPEPSGVQIQLVTYEPEPR